MVTLRNIRAAEKPFVGYGMNYSFRYFSIRNRYRNKAKWKLGKFGYNKVKAAPEK